MLVPARSSVFDWNERILLAGREKKKVSKTEKKKDSSMIIDPIKPAGRAAWNARKKRNSCSTISSRDNNRASDARWAHARNGIEHLANRYLLVPLHFQACWNLDAVPRIYFQKWKQHFQVYLEHCNIENLTRIFPTSVIVSRRCVGDFFQQKSHLVSVSRDAIFKRRTSVPSLAIARVRRW